MPAPAPDAAAPADGARRQVAPARAALDVLLADAAVGNPAVRIAREPVKAMRQVASVAAHPRRLARRGTGVAVELSRVARGTSTVAPDRSDHRFADPAWQRNWLMRRIAQGYLATGEAAMQLVEDAELDWEADMTARFVVENVHNLLAPTNFPWSNPTVLKETVDQGGANLIKGLRRAGRDVWARRLPAMVDVSRFEVGGNVAVTPGAVVHRTDVFELIEYRPTTETVYARPLLVAPPTINKYYALDLAPGRSMVEHLVAQGHRVFMISWCNPTEAESHYDLSTYAAAVIEAREVVAAISGQGMVNLMAACSGGIITAAALGHLAKTGGLGTGVGSLTLLVCALDNERAGTAGALARRELAAAAVAESARRGYVDGKALANVFAWLRPNDLVWGYVINNYLLGKEPPAFDILFWNQDAVRLAAGLHRDFVAMALDNALVIPNAVHVLGTPIDLGELDVDVYAVAGLNDHIVPWENVYRGARRLGGQLRFVLSTSGHIQALINPPGPNSKSSYRAAEDLLDEEEFLAGTPTISGSWWTDHSAWLAARAGDREPAPRRLGSRKYKPTDAAPGTYVHRS